MFGAFLHANGIHQHWNDFITKAEFIIEHDWKLHCSGRSITSTVEIQIQAHALKIAKSTYLIHFSNKIKMHNKFFNYSVEVRPSRSVKTHELIIEFLQYLAKSNLTVTTGSGTESVLIASTIRKISFSL